MTDQLDVDIRFLLANERTLLAWLRTALALQAGGAALLHFVHDDPGLPQAGMALLVLGAVTAAVGYVRYRAAQRAIRSGTLPRDGHGPMVVTGGVLVLAVTLIVVAAL